MNAQAAPLIVDFPSHPRGKSNACSKQSGPRSVRFSSLVEMTLSEASDGDQRSKFYSSEDKRRFQIEAARDARQIRATLVSGRAPEGCHQSQETACKFIGIEKLVLPDRARLIVEHRRAHAHAIVSRQDTCTAKELGRLSRASSRSDREEAYELAASRVEMI